MDSILMLSIFMLIFIGLMILYSTSNYNGQVKFQDQFYYLKKQTFATLLGMLGMYLSSQISFVNWKRYAVLGYLMSIGLSIAVLIFGREYNGSKRWLSLGPFSFQPSEFAKVALIIFLAFLVEKYCDRIQKITTMIKTLCCILPIVGLVGASNLSTAIIILGIGIVLIFVASSRYAQFVWMGAAGIGFMTVFLMLESYRLERIAIWRDPEQYEKGYQTIQGLYAIGSGGFFGNGTGNSIQKLGFVPEAQNDMIFSIICEEWGLVGAVFLLLLFVILIWRIFIVANKCEELFGVLIATGVMVHLMIQVILNISVVTNTIPNTGITLPFVSYGGTSVMFLLIEMGLVLNVSKMVK